MANQTSKAEAVRQFIATNDKARASQVVAELAKREINVTENYVRQIRAKAKKARRKRRTKLPSANTESASTKAWTFPKNSLEEAIRIPKVIEEKNAGNPMPATYLPKSVGFRRASDWRFLDLLRSANQYGLVSGTGQTATVRLEKLGQDIVAPGSAKQRQEALLAAFNNVPQFKAVAKFYGDKKIPEDEFFLNTLTREFNIPRERVEIFAEVFVANLNYLRAFDMVRTEGAGVGGVTAGLTTPGEAETGALERRVSKEPRVREFLDTCFVMMPFGAWFDRYYQDIYVPAIKEAGFEPIRADELFTTGSVVEQIWEQIQKARVLLADLTDRNANVFYELGLAHAARKPVVFTAPRVDDVPFDLRHLRVIIYEIREPEWSAKLRKSVTDYLKNALKEPEKSIPHPFRTAPDEEEEAQQPPARSRRSRAET